MQIPRFLIGDNAHHPEDIFIIHMDYPRFIINLKDDELEFLEEIEKKDKEELEEETKTLIEEASRFYDEQMEFYENE
jgi:UTP-glucose-1-phosphate uridylyltransferase